MNYASLKLSIWGKAKGNEFIAKGAHHYRDISRDILKETGYKVNADTIRNFMEGRHEPQPKVLDIYATYVLGGTTDQPKTYQDFETSLKQKPVLDRIGGLLKEGRRGFVTILSFLFLLVILVVLVLIRQDESSNSMYREIISSDSSVIAPKQSILNDKYPEQSIIEGIINDFPFDNSKVVSLEEAQRIMEWLGMRKLTLFTGGAEPHLSGYLSTGCSLTIWVGNYGERDTYRLRCSCEDTDYADLEPYYLTINKPKKTVVWEYSFEDPRLSVLQADDWFFFGDSTDLSLWSDKNHPDSSQYLTMRTLLGGPWLSNKAYDPITINILAHAIEIGSCAEIEVKLVDFNPYSRYQQAGFFLYFNDSEVPSISYKHAAAGRTNHIQASIREGEYSNEHLIHVSEFKNSILVSNIDFPDTPKSTAQRKVSSLQLKLRIENSTYFFSYSIDEGDFRPIRSKSFDLLQPKYIGLAAFQGRPEIPFPVYPVADVIDAKFEYVKISKCK